MTHIAAIGDSLGITNDSRDNFYHRIEARTNTVVTAFAVGGLRMSRFTAPELEQFAGGYTPAMLQCSAVDMKYAMNALAYGKHKVMVMLGTNDTDPVQYKESLDEFYRYLFEAQAFNPPAVLHISHPRRQNETQVDVDIRAADSEIAAKYATRYPEESIDFFTYIDGYDLVPWTPEYLDCEGNHIWYTDGTHFTPAGIDGLLDTIIPIAQGVGFFGEDY